jgi:hypothetical protein
VPFLNFRHSEEVAAAAVTGVIVAITTTHTGVKTIEGATLVPVPVLLVDTTTVNVKGTMIVVVVVVVADTMNATTTVIVIVITEEDRPLVDTMNVATMVGESGGLMPQAG